MKQIREVCHSAFCSWNMNFLFVWFFVLFFPHVLSAWVPLQKYNSNYQSDSKCYHQPINSLSPPAFPLFFIPPCLYLAVQLSAARHSPLYRWATAVKEGREGEKERKKNLDCTVNTECCSAQLWCAYMVTTRTVPRDFTFSSTHSGCVFGNNFSVFMSMNSLLPLSGSLSSFDIIEFIIPLSLSFSPSCSQAFWSYWDREDALPGNGVRQWRWDIDAVVSKVSPTCQTCELQPLGL